MAEEKKIVDSKVVQDGKVADSKVTRDNKAIMDDAVRLTLLDGKEYTFRSLPLPVAIRLVKKMNLINIMAPVVNLAEEKGKDDLLEALEIIFSQHHPGVTKEKLSTENIVNLRQIHEIINIALDINEIKK